jgi:putative sterol carrier protein
MSRYEETLTTLVKRFRPEAAQGLRAVYQLELKGEDGGVWHLSVEDQQCRLAAGPAERPSVTIAMRTADWESLVAGRLDVFQCLLDGRLELGGDLSLAAQLRSLFEL